MLTAEQIKTMSPKQENKSFGKPFSSTEVAFIKTLGYEYSICYFEGFIKRYSMRGYIFLYSHIAIINQVKSCKEAQSDLAKLREGGII